MGFSRKKNEIAFIPIDISKLDLTPLKKERIRPKVNREEVLKLHGNKCKMCGKSGEKTRLVMAHYKAHSKGGGQCFPACFDCHDKYDNGLASSADLKKLNLTKEDYAKYVPKGRKPVVPVKPEKKHYTCTARGVRACDWSFNAPTRAGIKCLKFNDGRKCPKLLVE